MIESFEVLKIVIFLAAVGFFWYLFTVERDDNKKILERLTAVEKSLAESTNKREALEKEMSERLAGWAQKMSYHKTQVEQLQAACSAIAQEHVEIKRLPRAKNFNVKFENLPIGVIQSKVKEAKKNGVKSGVVK